jgi:hypothetical protein
MPDKYFENYKKRVFDKLVELDRDIIPESWWETVVKHYYDQGYSPDRTVRVVLETMKKA